MTSPFTATLPSGTLEIEVKQATFPLDTLCGFASRRSNRRGFVFVSKVLGKHWPVAPSRFDACCEELAKKIQVTDESLLVVGMAETATGLGHGVYEALLRLHDPQALRASLYIHGSRYRIKDAPAITFEETHSHATTHWLHAPENQHEISQLSKARSLVIVDDEQTTGRTALALTQSIKKWCHNLQSVTIACLTDFVSDLDRHKLMNALGIECNFVSLLTGSYRFLADTSFKHDNRQQKAGILPAVELPSNFGRRGISGENGYENDIFSKKPIAPSDRVLVLGTGEFQYPALCWARLLEKQGHYVRFQSTTRSPLMVSGDLNTALEFADPYGEDIPHYLYNVSPDSYDRIFILHELREIPDKCSLAHQLNAEVISVKNRPVKQ